MVLPWPFLVELERKLEYLEINLTEQGREPTTNSVLATLVEGECTHHCTIPAPILSLKHIKVLTLSIAFPLTILTSLSSITCHKNNLTTLQKISIATLDVLLWLLHEFRDVFNANYLSSFSYHFSHAGSEVTAPWNGIRMLLWGSQELNKKIKNTLLKDSNSTDPIYKHENRGLKECIGVDKSSTTDKPELLFSLSLKQRQNPCSGLAPPVYQDLSARHVLGGQKQVSWHCFADVTNRN